MHEENYQLYLAIVDNRLHSPQEIEDVILAWINQAPVRVRDVATVRRGSRAPQFNRVSADGKEAVLLNIYGQPGCNTVQIADDLQQDLEQLRTRSATRHGMAFFYDQSQFVREGVRSVWEAIFLGLALVGRRPVRVPAKWRATLVAALVIPVTVLLTLIGLRLLGMSFNLMTLGGIAAVVGIVIDDAIVVVEAIYAKVLGGAHIRECREAGDPRSRPRTGRQHHDSRRCFHSSGVSGWRDRCLFPSVGSDDGDRPADLAGAGRHLDTGDRRNADSLREVRRLGRACHVTRSLWYQLAGGAIR